MMEIQLLDPKARGILEELVKLDLIRITDHSSRPGNFLDLLKTLRNKKNTSISDQELTSEIEEIRSTRHSFK